MKKLLILLIILSSCKQPQSYVLRAEYRYYPNMQELINRPALFYLSPDTVIFDNHLFYVSQTVFDTKKAVYYCHRREGAKPNTSFTYYHKSQIVIVSEIENEIPKMFLTCYQVENLEKIP